MAESKPAGSTGRGRLAELLVAPSCNVTSGGELNASEAVVDDEGVGIAFNRCGCSRTIVAQDKSRFCDAKSLVDRQTLFAAMREETFRPRDDRRLVYETVDAARAEYGPVWRVPTRELQVHGMRQRNGRLLFVAFAKESAIGQWRRFRLTSKRLADRLFEILGKI